MPDIEEILKKVDPTSAPSFSPDETKLFSGFAIATGFKSNSLHQTVATRTTPPD